MINSRKLLEAGLYLVVMLLLAEAIGIDATLAKLPFFIKLVVNILMMAVLLALICGGRNELRREE